MLRKWIPSIISVCTMGAVLVYGQPTPPPPPTPPKPPAPVRPSASFPRTATNRWVLLVNAAGLPASEFEDVRSYMEKDLWVRVEGIPLKARWPTLTEMIPTLFTSNRVVVVALGEGPEKGPWILSAPDDQWAVVNVSRFLAGTTNRTLRLRQAAMRAFGYVIGVPVCQDAHCVMRVLRRAPDPFMQMGSNFCGPSRRAYQSMVLQRGLVPVPPALLREQVTQGTPEQSSGNVSTPPSEK